MKRSDVSGEENSKEDMPNSPVPKFTLIQQSDENGMQTPIRSPRQSWFTSLCNCFKSIDTNYTSGKDQVLLEPQNVSDYGKNTLVLDLDETLVHSSFAGPRSDLTIDITVDRQKFKIFVLKRPGLEDFLQKCCDLYEVVIFTASLSVYADPLLDILDPHGRISFRLFRESCSFANGTYVKDLSRLGRDLKKVVIVDNSPTSYSFQPHNAIPIKTWMDDPNDRDLNQLWEILKILANVDDIPRVIKTVLERKLDFSSGSIGKVIDDVPGRGVFNSPVHAHGDKKFTFDGN